MLGYGTLRPDLSVRRFQFKEEKEMISKEKKAAIIAEYGRKEGDKIHSHTHVDSVGSTQDLYIVLAGEKEAFQQSGQKVLAVRQYSCKDNAAHNESAHHKVVSIKWLKYRNSLYPFG